MKTYELVLLAKEKQGTPKCSDRSFAIKNGFNYQSVIDWKSGKANANIVNFIKLGKLAGMDIDELEEFANKMEKRKNFKEAGFGDIGVLGTLSASSLGAVTFIKMSTLPYDVIGAWAFGSGAVYIMLN